MTEIQMLEIAQGIRDYLVTAGFTVDTILSSTPSDLSAILGIELYVAKLIFDAAKKASGTPQVDERTVQMLTE
ncbi:MAG TPA: hypothetical protein VFA15_06805 [Nitrososphaera sp.]|nr:hypothetical protein [Nitrososphaera sp.]